LLTRRAPFDEPVVVALIKHRNRPAYEPEELFPDPQTFPTHWLHGNPVKAQKFTPSDFIGDGGKGYEADVEMGSGDSFVRCIPNLLDLWVKKRGGDGRIYVKCWVYAPDSMFGIKPVWLPIEGRYRVQYGTSNIIEFEIRQ